LAIQVDGSADLNRSRRQPDDGKTLERVERHPDDNAWADRDRREVKHVVPIGIETHGCRIEDDFSRRRQLQRAIRPVGSATERLALRRGSGHKNDDYRAKQDGHGSLLR
jgi:hypothetical protein